MTCRCGHEAFQHRPSMNWKDTPEECSWCACPEFRLLETKDTLTYPGEL